MSAGTVADSAPERPPSVLVDVPSPLLPAGVVLLVPLGSTEQHGPHLPLDVDTAIAVAVSEGAAARIAGATVAPAIAYGASGEHQDFAGTVSVGTESLTRTLIELARSARQWVARIVFVNGHGGNVAALTAAMATLEHERTAVTWLPCRHGDAHAGRQETSLMLHLDPERVQMDAAAPGATEPLADLLPLMRVGGVRAVSDNGILGDPRGASAAEGADILERMVCETVAAVLSPPSSNGTP